MTGGPARWLEARTCKNVHIPDSMYLIHALPPGQTQEHPKWILKSL
jgi:hypothetical protein